jgi:hypothetical protein
MNIDQSLNAYATISANLKALKKHPQIIPLVEEIEKQLRAELAKSIVAGVLVDAELAAEAQAKQAASAPPAPPVPPDAK